jgi:16S rRNA (uracil1498-N3)-methyltransferase
VRRFFVSRQEISGGQAFIRGDELQHLVRVLRLGVGDPVIVFDGQGREYQGVIDSLSKEQAVVRLNSSLRVNRESPIDVWLAQGIAKGDKMEFIIQKAVELGVRGIIPLATQRTVVKLEGEKKKIKEQRWQKVVVEAAKQCGRIRLPDVFPCTRVPDFLAGLPLNKILLVPWEKGGVPLKAVLTGKEYAFRQSCPVYILIGPEGGLEEEEVAMAAEAGGIPVTLGPRILRTETAGLVATAVIMYQWGDIG